jgi:hypothetical protein
MNNSSYFYLSLIILFFSQSLIAQIPQDFQLLDHRGKITEHLDSKLFGDQLLYGVSKNSFEMTSINLVDLNSFEVDTLLLTFAAKSELRSFSDGTFNFFVHSLFNYDIDVPGLFNIFYDGSQLVVDTLPMYTVPIQTSFTDELYPAGAAQISNGDYYIIDHFFLYYVEPNNLTSLREVSYSTQLFQNDNREVYLFEDDLVVKIEEATFDTLPTFSKSIIDIQNRGSSNDVLMEGMIQSWNDDFSQLLFTWEFIESIESFYEVHVTDTLLTVLNSEGASFTYRNINSQGEESILSSGNIENEEVIGFHQTSDSSLLSMSNCIDEDLQSAQLMFRAEYLDVEQSYDGREVSIDSASLVFVRIDTFNEIIISPNESFFETWTIYDLFIDITNRSDTAVSQMTFFTEDYSFSGFGDLGQVINLQTELLPGESYSINAGIKLHYNDLEITDPFFVSLPGADFRKNNHPTMNLAADFIVSTDELSLDDQVILFPNPTSDLINIQADTGIEEVSVYNTQGQLMLHLLQNAGIKEVDVSHLDNGCYYINLRSKDQGKISTTRIVKL